MRPVQDGGFMTGLGCAGLVFAVLSLLHFAFKMTVVYDVAGDPLGGGGVPTLDAVLFAPIGLTLGLFLLAQWQARRFSVRQAVPKYDTEATNITRQ
jgi:hypothetical protein